MTSEIKRSGLVRAMESVRELVRTKDGGQKNEKRFVKTKHEEKDGWTG